MFQRIPLRCRSAGVWVAPAHTNTCAACTSSGRGMPSGSVCSHSAPMMRLPWRTSSGDAAVGDDACARGDRAREHRARHGLLDRAAVRVRSGTRGRTRPSASPSFVAPRSSTADDAGGAPGRRDTPSSLFDAFRVTVERVGAELLDAVLALPFLGQLGRQPVVQAAVDLGAAADAAAFGVRDRGAARAPRTNRRGGTSRPSPATRTARARRDRPTGPLRGS